MFDKSKKSKKSLLIQILENNIYFSNLSYQEQKIFAPFMHKRTFEKDEILFFRSDPSNGIYILLEGEVDYIAKTNHDKNEECFKTFKKYDLIGENSFIGHNQRLATAVARKNGTNMYFLPTARIAQIFEEYPKIKGKILTTFAQIFERYQQNIFKLYIENLNFFELKDVFK